MADETPGTTVAAPAPTAPETQPAAPQDAQTGAQPATQPDPYADFPVEVREKVKEREAKAKEAALNEYRAKAGAEGGWMSQLSPEVREELKRDPSTYWRYKAEAEAYRKIAEGGFVQSRVDAPKKVDPEQEAAEWLDAQLAAKPDMTVQEYGKLQLKAQARLARAIAEETSGKAAKNAYTEMSTEERTQTVNNQPEMKNTFFNALYTGMKEKLREMGKPQDPFQAFAMTREAWKQMFPNAPVNNTPVPVAPAADTKRTPVVSAPTALNGRELWLRSEEAQRMAKGESSQ